jgi:hypothetical protein
MMRLGRRRSRADAIPGYYRRFSRAMAQRGLEREAGETLAAYHRRLEQAGIDFEVVARVDRAIERDLYSLSPLPASERDDLAVMVRHALSRPPRRARGAS